MVLFSHVVVGATVGKLIPDPLYSIPIAFFSHFILDMFPHVQEPTEEGYKPNKYTVMFSVLDISATVVFLFFLNNSVPINNFLIMGPVIASFLPDLLDITRYNKFLYQTFEPYYHFHDKVQNETQKPIGYLTQIILFVVCLAIIYS